MKKLVLSALTVASTLTMAAGATGAYFTSSASSTSNTFSSGTMTILLSDFGTTPETQQAAISDSWEGEDLAPGDVLPEQRIVVRNDGTVDADHFDLDVSYTGSDELADSIIFTTANSGFRFGPDNSGANSHNLLQVLTGGGPDTNYTLTIGGSPVGDLDTDDNGLSLKELADAGVIRVSRQNNGQSLDAGTEATLWINSMVATSLTTQGESVEAAFSFTMHQDSSQ